MNLFHPSQQGNFLINLHSLYTMKNIEMGGTKLNSSLYIIPIVESRVQKQLSYESMSSR